MSEKFKFNDQAFLFDFLSDVLSTKKILPSPTEYIQRSEQEVFPVNTLVPPRSKEVLSLKNTELSFLVPKVKIYKIKKGRNNELVEEEFKFTSFSTKSDILASSRGRGNDVGLMSFVWSDTGTNPANSGLSFQAEMKLHFQSFEAIFHPRDPHPPFSDLFIPAGAKRSKEDNLKTTYDDSDFQIKAEVGWATPSDPQGKVFRDPSIIDNTRVNLVMTLTSHDIDIKDTGAVEVTLKYVAAIEGRFLSPKGDLLTIPKLDVNELEKIEETIRKIKALERRARQNAAVDVEIIRQAGGVVGSEAEAQNAGLTNAAELNKKRAQKIIDSSLKELELQKEKLRLKGKSLALSLKSQMYRNILEDIFNKIYFIDLSPQAYNQYVDIQSIDKEPDKDAPKGDIKKTFSSTITEAKRLMKELKTLNNGKINIQDSRNVLPLPGTYTLNFVFLGDIINSILKIYKDKNNKEIDDFSFELGNVPIFNISSGEYVNINLKDVPISLKYYESWFRQNVLNKNMQSLSLQFYLKSLCSSLIYSVLNKIRFQNSSPVRPRLSYVTTYGKKSRKNKINQNHFIYSGGFGSDTLKGVKTVDETKNIFHLYVGASQGLVKNIKFSRTDLPGLREARIDSSRQLSNRSLLFSDFYKSNISLFGNTIFKPGMIVYINTTAIGLAPTGENTKRIGLSGYYNVIKTENIIESGKFETNLELMSLGNKENFQKIGAKITSERQTLEKISDDPNVKKALGIGRQKSIEEGEKRAAEVREDLKAQGLDPKSQRIKKKQGFSRIQ